MARHEHERCVAGRPRGVGVQSDTEPWFQVGPATIGLALINVAAFVALTINSGLDDVLGLPPGWNEVLERPWTLLSVAFTAANLLHLALAVPCLSGWGETPAVPDYLTRRGENRKS